MIDQAIAVTNEADILDPCRRVLSDVCVWRAQDDVDSARGTILDVSRVAARCRYGAEVEAAQVLGVDCDPSAAAPASPRATCRLDLAHTL
jgi:hypothetical protein